MKAHSLTHLTVDAGCLLGPPMGPQLGLPARAPTRGLSFGLLLYGGCIPTMSVRREDQVETESPMLASPQKSHILLIETATQSHPSCWGGEINTRLDGEATKFLKNMHDQNYYCSQFGKRESALFSKAFSSSSANEDNLIYLIRQGDIRSI